MPLVDYASSPSDSDSDVDQKVRTSPAPTTSTNSLKRKRPSSASRSSDEIALPPLPASFHDLYAFAARSSTQDNPALHGGRKRAVPHIWGNWPSHVYLEWQPSSIETMHLNQLITALASHLSQNSRGQLHSLFKSDLETPRPLHISLSQPLNLHTDQRNDFVEALASAVRRPAATQLQKAHYSGWNATQAQGRVKPFTTRLTALDWVSNADGTRWFLAFRVMKPNDDSLNQLLFACNQVARDFGQAELYAVAPKKTKWREHTARPDGKVQPPEDKIEGLQVGMHDCFHFSIAWMLEEPVRDVTAEQLFALERVDSQLANALKELRNIELRFDAVKLKVGNEVIPIVLSDKIEQGYKGILGN